MRSKVIFFAICMVRVLHAQSVVLPESLATQATEYRRFIQPESNLPALTSDQEVTQIVSHYDAQIGAEVRITLKKPTNYDPLRFITQVLDVTKLVGLEYYSASRKHFRQFVFDAYHFSPENPDRREKAPHFTDVPRGHSSYVVLETVTFGKNEFIIRLSHRDNRFLIQLLNRNKVRLKSFPYIKIADPQHFASIFLVEEQEDTISVYAFSGVHNKLLDPANKIAPKKKVAQSLTNRLIALTSRVYTYLE